MDLLSFCWLSLKFLLACSIKSTVLLALAWLTAIFLRSRSAALRHRVWASAIIASLALPVFMFLLPAWQAAPLRGTPALSSMPMTETKTSLDSLPAMIINARLDSQLSANWRALSRLSGCLVSSPSPCGWPGVWHGLPGLPIAQILKPGRVGCAVSRSFAARCESHDRCKYCSAEIRSPCQLRGGF